MKTYTIKKGDNIQFFDHDKLVEKTKATGIVQESDIWIDDHEHGYKIVLVYDDYQLVEVQALCRVEIANTLNMEVDYHTEPNYDTTLGTMYMEKVYTINGMLEEEYTFSSEDLFDYLFAAQILKY